MSRGIFVTGTNTGVGKTVITRALVRAARLRGIDAVALKPVESGVVPGEATDASALAAAADRGDASESLTAYAFRTPVSPHLAARIEGCSIEPERIQRFLTEWQTQASFVIAEGAGGLLVPLAPNVTFADVIAASGFSLVIVAPDVLGTINVTLLTLEAAARRNIPVAGVVFNGTPDGAWENAEAVAAYGDAPVLGRFPTCPEDTADEELGRLAADCLDLDRLFFGRASARHFQYSIPAIEK